MRTVPGFCVSFSNFPRSILEQTIAVNHPQSPQLISFVCVQKNSPRLMDLMSRSQSAATEKQILVDTPPHAFSHNMLAWFPEPQFKRGEKCSAAKA